MDGMKRQNRTNKLESRMITISQRRRFWTMAALLCLAFMGLGYRLVDLQIVRHEELSKSAQRNTLQEVLFKPRRGEIRDIRGNPLVTSMPVKTVCADPVLIGDRQLEVARVLSSYLEIPENELLQRLQPRLRTNAVGQIVTNRYVVLKRQVLPETWQQITQAMSQLVFGLQEKKLSSQEQSFYQNLRKKSIRAEEDQIRVYPNQTLASHVLGHVGFEERQINDRDVLEMVGRDGVELTMNSVLRGVYGWRLTEMDSWRRELVGHRNQDVAPRNGYHVVLTIDARLQDIVEAELAEAVKKHTPVSASAILIRPRTGQVLAMATLPNYDPNKPGAVPVESRRNRVITDMAEPGSTYKIVVVSAGLNERIVTLDDLIDCENGRFSFGGRILREHESRGYGLLSVEGIVTKSSNIGSAKIGIRLGPEKLYAYIRSFGFGARSGIALPGEIAGLVHPVSAWSKLSISRIPMGHEVAVTPLQMVMAMAALANEGRLMQPMLIDRLEDQEGRVVTQYQAQVVRQVVSEATARQMVTALKGVVSTNGTGRKARLQYYTVAGKTGTAQKPGLGGYVPGKYFSSFVGFFPADQPEVCLSVVFDEPQNGFYGGEIACPVFKAMAERIAAYLGIKPDIGSMDVLAKGTEPDPLTKTRVQ
jgi:cell division protein FtsI/penicillin-binding protein 2